jgi:hypothetical protein
MHNGGSRSALRASGRTGLRRRREQQLFRPSKADVVGIAVLAWSGGEGAEAGAARRRIGAENVMRPSLPISDLDSPNELCVTYLTASPSGNRELSHTQSVIEVVCTYTEALTRRTYYDFIHSSIFSAERCRAPSVGRGYRPRRLRNYQVRHSGGEPMVCVGTKRGR